MLCDYTGTVMATTKTSRAKRAAPRKRRASTATKPWTSRTFKSIRILQVPAFSNIPWLVHGFSTRPGGASTLDGKRVLNLGFTEWDSRENVRENRRRFQSALRADELALAPLLQFHSDSVLCFDAPPEKPSRADASITNRPGMLLAVQTADCVPILWVARRNRAVAAGHAGWRGTLQRIGTKTIGRLQMQFANRPQDLLAAVGPAIGGCCYEVGTEVAAAFTAQFSNAAEFFDELRTGDEPNPLQWLNMAPPGHQPPPRKVLLDLRKAIRSQLLESGILAKNISSTELCTACRTDLLFSYRKQGSHSGR